MKAHEIRELKKEEIIKRIAEEEKNIIDLRFAHQLKQLTNTAKLKMAKSDIARMKSILNEMESAENKTVDTKEGVTA